MEERWKKHVADARTNKRYYFTNAIRRYGEAAFSHTILETCHDLKAANAAERKWIKRYRTTYKAFGFNLTPGGAHMPHPVRLKKNLWQDPVYKAKVLAAIRSPATKAKVQAIFNSPDMKKKLSEISKANNARPEVRLKNSVAHTGKTYGLAFRRKMSEISRIRPIDPQRYSKISETHRQKHAPEGMKHCKNCNQDYPRTSEFFYRNRSRGDGLHHLCISCHRERACIPTHAKRK
jgi:hypothetical protein